LEAELLGLLGKILDHPLTVAFFVLCLALVHVLLACRQHRVYEPGQFVGAGGDGSWLIHPGAQPAIVGAQGRLAVTEIRRRHFKSLRGPVGGALGGARQDLGSPEIFVPGHSPNQEAKCLALLKRERSAPTSAIGFQKFNFLPGLK